MDYRAFIFKGQAALLWQFEISQESNQSHKQLNKTGPGTENVKNDNLIQEQLRCWICWHGVQINKSFKLRLFA